MKREIAAFLTGLSLLGYGNLPARADSIDESKSQKIQEYFDKPMSERAPKESYILEPFTEEETLIENKKPLAPPASEELQPMVPLAGTERKRPTLDDITKALKNDGYNFQDLEHAIQDTGTMYIERPQVEVFDVKFYLQRVSHKGKSEELASINSGGGGFSFRTSLGEWASQKSFPTFDVRFDMELTNWFKELRVGDSWKAKTSQTFLCPSFTLLYRPIDIKYDEKGVIFGADAMLLDTAIGVTNKHCSSGGLSGLNEEEQKKLLENPKINFNEFKERNMVMYWVADKYAFMDGKLNVGALLGWIPYEAGLNDTFTAIYKVEDRKQDYPFSIRMQLDAKYNFFSSMYLMAGGWAETDGRLHIKPYEFNAGIGLLSYKGKGLSLTWGTYGGEDNTPYVLWNGPHVSAKLYSRLSFHAGF